MAVGVSEYELEALPELEAGHEGGQNENEQFFGALANLARRGAGWLTAAGSPQRRFGSGPRAKPLTAAFRLWGDGRAARSAVLPTEGPARLWGHEQPPGWAVSCRSGSMRRSGNPK